MKVISKTFFALLQNISYRLWRDLLNLKQRIKYYCIKFVNVNLRGNCQKVRVLNSQSTDSLLIITMRLIWVQGMSRVLVFQPLKANPQKRSNTTHSNKSSAKPTNCYCVFDHFVTKLIVVL